MQHCQSFEGFTFLIIYSHCNNNANNIHPLLAKNCLARNRIIRYPSETLVRSDRKISRLDETGPPDSHKFSSSRAVFVHFCNAFVTLPRRPPP